MVPWLSRCYIWGWFGQVPCTCSGPAYLSLEWKQRGAGPGFGIHSGVRLPPPQLAGRVQRWNSAGGPGVHCWGMHEVEVSHIPDAVWPWRTEDGFESKWVVGLTWHTEETVNGNFPLYVADTSVNLFMDCRLFMKLNFKLLSAVLFPTSAVPSNTNKCWYFDLAVYFFWFLLVLPGVAWFDLDCKLIRNK